MPLKTLNPLGVHADQMQAVPILCYHRFGPTPGKASTGLGKMTVSAATLLPSSTGWPAMTFT